MNLLLKIKNMLWGKLSLKEFKQFGMLGIILMFILGAYWLMKPLKDGIFLKMVGRDYLAYAKGISVLIIIPLALGYAKLVDIIQKQKLFYVISTCYLAFFVISSMLLSHPTIGLANTIPSPTRVLGWTMYVAIEIFATLNVALFWSFVVSSTKTDAAKRGYGLVLFLSQIGTITGSFMATQAPRLGVPLLALVVAFAVFLVPVLVKIFITLYPKTAEKKPPSKKQRTGPIEGLRLLVTKPYLIGIFGVAALWEFPAQLVDFCLKFTADAKYFTAENLTWFGGIYGMTINTITLFITLLGTSLFIRKMGIAFCLALFPILVAVATLNAWMFPTLWVLFGAMVTFKALSYGLNNPCKEMLYIPTSKDIKFKAKSWIDMFGQRTSKVTGAMTTKLFPQLNSLIYYGPLIALGLIGIWLSAAIYTGRAHKKLIKSKKILK